MRLVRFLIAALCLAAGAAVGILNRSAVVIDLGAFEIHSTLGVVLISSLMAGALAGGVAGACGMMHSRPGHTHEGHDGARPEV